MGERTAPLHTGFAVLGGAFVLVGLYLTSLHSYLLFHTLIELFTIVVAMGVFVIAWNARAYLANNYVLFVGLSSAFVAFIDLLHTVAYRGMGVLGDGRHDLSTQLWVAGRYLQTASLVVAPFLLRRRVAAGIMAAALGVATALLLLSIFYWGVFPTAYVEGTGLTAFKRVSEYVICLLLLAAVALLARKRAELDPTVWRLLNVYLVLTVASELAFTEYVSVYGGMNLVGHLLRLVAFWALYRALIVIGLAEPYALLLRSLKLSEQQATGYAAELERRNEALKRSERQLRQDAVALQSRNEELDAFARTVAHDLKNPLSVIVSASSFLRGEMGDVPPDRAKDLLERVQSTALAMNRIVDGLLLLSQVRKAEAPRGPVDMAAVVRNTENRLSEMIRDSAATVVHPDEWPAALGYGPWLEEVWSNYIMNALKYGGRPPRVELGASRMPDGGVRFWVRDNGEGLAPDLQERLFVPFTRLETHGTGHGLGLSIVFQIVEKLGGTVGVDSQRGAGCTFYFTLPAASGVAAPARPAAVPA